MLLLPSKRLTSPPEHITSRQEMIANSNFHHLRDTILLSSMNVTCAACCHRIFKYFHYYHKTRTRLSLNKDCPQTRSTHPPTAGKIIAFPEVGGLHHRYERRAA